MQAYPHHYHASAEGTAEGSIRVTADTAPALETFPPPEFDGPPGYWSPESLLLASIADCYILSFRAVARASKLEWENLSVAVEGVLDRVEGVTRFVAFTVKPTLHLADAARERLASTVLDKAKRACLVTNSLIAACELEPAIVVAPQPAAA